MKNRRAPQRVVAYVHVPTPHGFEPGPLWHTRAGAAQQSAVARWAAASDAVVVSTAVERAASGLDGAGDRVAFVNAMTSVRDGLADAFCVASLESLDEDVVLQELLLGEARRSHVPVVSAHEPDVGALADPPADQVRAEIRRALESMGEFQGEMRSLRAWIRRNEIADGFERLGPALAELESIQEHRASNAEPMGESSWTERHRIARMLRAMRFTQ